ncbi:MAG: hypothetical protein KDH18_25480 [Rhodoferax sp.]|nr:hypothetical protein [Rhodoferax sp.]
MDESGKLYKEGQGYLDQYRTGLGQGFDRYADAIGANGQDRQRSFLDSYVTDPYLERIRKQGIDTINASGAAQGLLRSGGQMKELYGYGAGLEKQFMDEQLGRLGGFAQMAPQVGGMSANLAAQRGKDVLGAYTTMGGVAASGIAGAQNAQNQGSQNIMNTVGYLSGKLMPSPQTLQTSFNQMMPQSGWTTSVLPAFS